MLMMEGVGEEVLIQILVNSDGASGVRLLCVAWGRG